MSEHDREEHRIPLGTFFGRTLYGVGIFNRSLETVESIAVSIGMWKRFTKAKCVECCVLSRISLHEWQMALLLKQIMNLDKLRFPNRYSWSKWEKGEKLEDLGN